MKRCEYFLHSSFHFWSSHHKTLSVFTNLLLLEDIMCCFHFVLTWCTVFTFHNVLYSCHACLLYDWLCEYYLIQILPNGESKGCQHCWDLSRNPWCRYVIMILSYLFGNNSLSLTWAVSLYWKDGLLKLNVIYVPYMSRS